MRETFISVWKSVFPGSILLIDDFVWVEGGVGEVRFDLEVHAASLQRNKLWLKYLCDGHLKECDGLNVQRGYLAGVAWPWL